MRTKRINTHSLAKTFSAILLAEIGEANLREVVKRNVGIEGSCCASHDFCDANMCMDEAFSKEVGYFDLQNDDHIAACNEAWGLAKDAGFYI